MKRTGCPAVAALAAVVMCAGIVLACDDHVGKCELEAWRASTAAMGLVNIDGSATCDKGSAIIRMYDGDKFLGVATGLARHNSSTARRPVCARRGTLPSRLAPPSPSSPPHPPLLPSD